MAEQNWNTAEFDLDAPLGGIEDVPGFGIFHPGAHPSKFVKFEKKKVGEHPALQVDFQYVGPESEFTVPLNPSAGDEAPKIGDIMSQTYMLDNKISLDQMKKVLLFPFAKKLGLATVISDLANVGANQILQGAKDLGCIIITNRVEKDGKVYGRLKNLMPL